MDSEEISRLIGNEKEWRIYTLSKLESLNMKVESFEAHIDTRLDKIENDMTSFKSRVMGIVTAIATTAGLSADYIMKIFKGI